MGWGGGCRGAGGGGGGECRISTVSRFLDGMMTTTARSCNKKGRELLALPTLPATQELPFLAPPGNGKPEVGAWSLEGGQNSAGCRRLRGTVKSLGTRRLQASATDIAR